MSEAIGAGASVAGTRVGRQRTLWGGAFGHFIEFYDWSIYGFLAGIFAAQMFPAGNPTVSLIASFSAFAVRVSVCQWAYSRPVVSTNGNS